MKKITQRIIACVLSFALITILIPNNIAKADDDKIHVKALINLQDLEVGDTIKDIKVVAENSSLKITNGDKTFITSVVPEVYEVIPYNEIYMDNCIRENQKFDLYEPYIVYFKYDLSNVNGADKEALETFINRVEDIDEDMVLDEDSSLFFDEENMLKYGDIVGEDILKHNMYYDLCDFYFDDDEKSLGLYMTFFVNDGKVTDSKVSNCTLISNTSNGLAFELNGKNITDYIEARIIKGTSSSAGDFATPFMDMYSFDHGNGLLYNPMGAKDAGSNPINKYGDVGTNIDRTKAVVTFKYEGEALEPGDYSVCFYYRKNNLDNKLVTNGEVFNFTIPGTSSAKDIISGSCKLIENGYSIYYECNLGEKFDKSDFSVIPFDESQPEMVAIYFETELLTGKTFDREDEDIYINGKKIDVYVEGEEELYQAAIDSGKSGIQIGSDTVNIAIPLDLSLEEIPSSTNDFTIKLKDKNEYIKNYKYLWKESIDVIEKDVEIKKKDTEGSKLNGDVLLYDTEEKFFVRKNPSDTRERGDMFVEGKGIASKTTNSLQYTLDIIVSSEDLCAGDEITLYLCDTNSGPFCPSAELTDNERYFKHNNDCDEYFITLEENDITDNSVRINLSAFTKQFELSYIEIKNSGKYEKELSEENKNYLQNPVAGKKYVCNIYSAEHYVLDYNTQPILVEDVPVTHSSSKKYKANDTKDTAEKISGSGKKGSTRTITPQEGRKVSSVVVTDKDGNKIDVTLNEDGTYSFVQPASNVDVQVNYKNREITLNIGSTEASVDGETSNLDVAPILRNDRTMLPIRFVAENLGAKVEWDEKNPNYVVITRGDTKIEITLGSDIMKVNGKDVLLDSVAFAENDRTYLPVRAVSEALNAVVEWNEARPNEVKIYEQ